MRLSDSQKRWRERYYNSVREMTKKYIRLNKKQPVITRKITDIEKEEWSNCNNQYGLTVRKDGI